MLVLCCSYLFMFLTFILPDIFWASSWLCGFVSDLGKISVTIASHVSSSFSSSFLWYSHYARVTSFIVVPQLIDILFCFPHSYFLLLFSFGSLYWDILKFKDSFLSHVQSRISPFKIFFISVLVSLISSISFFFLRIFFLLLTLPIFSCILSTLSVLGLSISITVALNSSSDNSSIPAIWSGSDTCSALQTVFFAFLYAL